MSKNIGSIDKIVRILIGLTIGVFGIVYQSWWGLIGIVPMATALMGSCPLYPVLGMSTTGKKETK